MRFGLGLRTRVIHAWRAFLRRRRQAARRPLLRRSVEKLHIGSGPLVRSGWSNVDLDAHGGVQFVLDVRDGLPFRDVAYIYAEHFLEHLTYDEGIRFLKECRSVLRHDGVLRLSTPNLDWVWLTHYQRSADPIGNCFAINKAFRGWGHQFLYNLSTLEATLHAAGFAEVVSCRYGESSDPVLLDLERHEKSLDEDALPHVVIVEARGISKAKDDLLETAVADYDWAIHP